MPMAIDHTLSRGIVAKLRSARRSYSRRASAGRPVCRYSVASATRHAGMAGS